MHDPRKLTLWISIGATLFVLATAIFIRNPGLYILAAISAGSSLMLWQQRKRG